MPTAVDLTGRVFNRLTVLRFIESRPTAAGHKRRIYLVRCDCGVEREAVGTEIVYGSTKSCGCLKRDGSRFVTHGHTRGGWTAETRCLYDAIAAAVEYRDATRAAVSKVRLHRDTETAYDRAAAKLDGALNELRVVLKTGMPSGPVDGGG